MADSPTHITLDDFPYRGYEGDASDVARAAVGWLNAVQALAADALGAGLPVDEVMPAVVQMLEGWMLAREPASLATSWSALDATVTVLERRLRELRHERDRLLKANAKLRAKLRRRRRRRDRGSRERKG